ncbi:MAG: hypothetical protein H6Q56_541 [Deltaproteobacteria bacterium]|nr:hypothetical protein [Deltaproteobacteria bacterium]
MPPDQSQKLRKKLVEADRKPGPVPASSYLKAGASHSSRIVVTDDLKRPTREHGRAALNAPLLGLAPGGVYLASDVTAGPGELLPHPFTLTCLHYGSGRRTSLCGTIPGVTPAGRYPAPYPVEPGLSSPLPWVMRRLPDLLQPNRIAIPVVPVSAPAFSGSADR